MCGMAGGSPKCSGQVAVGGCKGVSTELEGQQQVAHSLHMLQCTWVSVGTHCAVAGCVTLAGGTCTLQDFTAAAPSADLPHCWCHRAPSFPFTTARWGWKRPAS